MLVQVHRGHSNMEAAIVTSELTPLEYMLTTMRDETKPISYASTWQRLRRLMSIRDWLRWNRRSKSIHPNNRPSPSHSWNRSVPWTIRKSLRQRSTCNPNSSADRRTTYEPQLLLSDIVRARPSGRKGTTTRDNPRTATTYRQSP